MSGRKLKILIIDGSFETTSFIRRMIQSISDSTNVSVMGFTTNNKFPLEGVQYVAVGNNKSRWHTILLSIKWAMVKPRLRELWKLMGHLLSGNRKEVYRHNIDKALRQIEPDIVHLQWPSLIPWFEKALRAQQYKFVLSQRGYHTNVRPFVDILNYEYLHEYYPYFSGFHSVSKAISKMGDLLYTSDSKIDKVIYSGFDVTDLKYETKIQKSDYLNIISVGRPHWKKGYAYAIQACKILLDKGVNFNYTIVGAAQEEELLYLLHEYGLQSYIALEPRLSQNEVYRRIQGADVLLLPSLEEGIANVAVEAMLLGTPVISTNCGGMEELIENNKSGWITPTRDAVAIFIALSRILHLDSESLEKICQAAHEKVVSEFTVERMKTNMIALYKEVLEN